MGSGHSPKQELVFRVLRHIHEISKTNKHKNMSKVITFGSAYTQDTSMHIVTITLMWSFTISDAHQLHVFGLCIV